VALYHLHIHPRVIAGDINTLFPLERLLSLAAEGEIGGAAERHYSYMGYILEPQALLAESTPAMIRHLEADGVDLVVLVPG
jgi:D-proline reductase (dithiol) PrdB